MSKIFSKNQGPAVDVKRNTFDLSFASHVTGKIGDLIPVFCQEVIPGDSFEIDPKFGLRFNPTVFPIQTKMHGIMHFFYVRNRNLYKDWPEYITQTKDDAVLPYLYITENRAQNIIGTGSLGDYLGVPTTLTGDYAQKMTISLDITVPTATVTTGELSVDNPFNNEFLSTPLGLVNRKSSSYFYIPSNLSEGGFDAEGLQNQIIYWKKSNSVLPGYENPSYKRMIGLSSSVKINHPIDRESTVYFNNPFNVELGSQCPKGIMLAFFVGPDADSTLSQSNIFATVNVADVVYEEGEVSGDIAEPLAIDKINEVIGTGRAVYVSVLFDTSYLDVTSFISTPDVLSTNSTFKQIGESVTFDISGVHVLDATDLTTVVNNPFVVHTGQTTPKIKLNALPFRAYESIYNYFYRDETVDPFKINNKEVYNDFITTHAGGADSTNYHLYQKNWERDYYTSCQVSPQQGTAPLIGISANGTFTFDDGTNQYTASMTIGEDGETITGISTYSPDMPKGSLRQLMDVVTNGISINDIRNVGSLQAWLETNIRRGYKYVDQIYSHFGVNPAFKANDMPEFIGGIHTVGDVNQVTNMTGDGLGDYAGQLTMFGGSDNKIHTYCDEHGYIIGIMCVFPEPVYSQMLPKHFIKTETPLDFFFPEFGHIGMQPMTYNEVTPLEVAVYDKVNNTDTLNDTFGYQRAWADYLANNDQVHGDFRTNLSEFVVNRVFNSKPELGHDFIAIDHKDVDDVFVVQDGSDKMLGELRFDVKAKRPIPRFGIPRMI